METTKKDSVMDKANMFHQLAHIGVSLPSIREMALVKRIFLKVHTKVRSMMGNGKMVRDMGKE